MNVFIISDLFSLFNPNFLIQWHLFTIHHYFTSKLPLIIISQAINAEDQQTKANLNNSYLMY